MKTPCAALNGISLEGKVLVIDFSIKPQNFDPLSDLHVAPLDEMGRHPSLFDLKLNGQTRVLRKIWRATCLAMEHLHGMGSLHGLLTPEKFGWDRRRKRVLISGWHPSDREPTLDELRFCPPERLAGSSFTPATDVYFLTGLLFFIETGNPVHRAEREDALRQEVLENTLYPGLAKKSPHPPALATVSRGISTGASERYPNVSELVQAAEPVFIPPSSEGFWSALATGWMGFSMVLGTFLWFMVFKYA